MRCAEQPGKDIWRNRVGKELRTHIPPFMDSAIKTLGFLVTEGTIVVSPVRFIVGHSLSPMPSGQAQQVLQEISVQTVLHKIRQPVQLLQTVCLVVHGLAL